MDERTVARALGLIPKAQAATRTPSLKVVLSVRHQWGGRPLRFEHVEPTVSRLLAEVEAHKAARKQGYQVWCTLEITSDLSGVDA